jgi:hypothetical protein
MAKTCAGVCALAIALGPGAALAETFVAKQKGGKLTLTEVGEGMATIELRPPIDMLAPRGAGSGVTVEVVPAPGTTVDGSTTPVRFEGVDDVTLKMGTGGGFASLNGLTLPGSLQFSSRGPVDLDLLGTNLGDDLKAKFLKSSEVVIAADSTIADDLILKGGVEPDSVMLDGTVLGTAKVAFGHGANSFAATGTVTDDVVLKTGKDVDTVNVAGAALQQDFVASLGAGNSFFTVTDTTTIGGSLRMKGGSGVDAIVIDTSSIGDDLNLSLSSENNTVSLTDVTIIDDITVKAGSGDDTVTLNGTNAIGGDHKYSLDGGMNTSPPSSG